jgi:hypothetical protein
MAADGDLLTDIDRPILAGARELLARAIEGEDPDAIIEAIGQLESAALPFVERRMNRAVSLALAGHSLGEVADQYSTGK